MSHRDESGGINEGGLEEFQRGTQSMAREANASIGLLAEPLLNFASLPDEFLEVR